MKKAEFIFWGLAGFSALYLAAAYSREFDTASARFQPSVAVQQQQPQQGALPSGGGCHAGGGGGGGCGCGGGAL